MHSFDWVISGVFPVVWGFRILLRASGAVAVRGLQSGASDLGVQSVQGLGYRHVEWKNGIRAAGV